MLNVGSRKGEEWPGQGPIFSDGTFKYVPIPEIPERVREEFKKELRTYEALGLGSYVDPEFREEFVHEDPEFKTFTYGHVERGFGDIKALTSLKKGDYLLFMANLRYFPRKTGERRLSWINPDWGAYIIGYFVIDTVITQEEYLSSPELRELFKNNAHYKWKWEEHLREKYRNNLWIKGKSGHLLRIAVPLSDSEDPTKPNSFLYNNFTTTGGKPINKRNWYRWTLISNKISQIKNFINKFQSTVI